MQQQLSGATARGIARDQLNPARPNAPAILRAVGKVHGIAPHTALQRQSGMALKHAVYLLRRRGNLSLKEVADKATVSIGRVAQIQSEIEST